jgi:hypothetical protein
MRPIKVALITGMNSAMYLLRLFIVGRKLRGKKGEALCPEIIFDCGSF